MKRFVVSCIHRESGEPYDVLVDAVDSDAARDVAAQDHIAGNVREFQELPPSPQRFDAEALELLRSIDRKLMDRPQLKAAIRGGVFRGLVQWFLYCLLAWLLLWWLWPIFYSA